MKTRNEMIQWCIDVEFDFSNINVEVDLPDNWGFVECPIEDNIHLQNVITHQTVNYEDVYGTKLPDRSVTITTTEDVVRKPKHYAVLGDVEAIHIIAASMTVEGFHGYCMGNIIKYRLRAGNKDNVNQELSKADFYTELFDMHKHLCRGYVGEDK